MYFIVTNKQNVKSFDYLQHYIMTYFRARCQSSHNPSTYTQL